MMDVILAHPLLSFLGLLSLLCAYFAPTLVAFRRRVPQRLPLLALNTLLGWTVLAWVVGMGAALMQQPEESTASAGA